jgi:protease I
MPTLDNLRVAVIATDGVEEPELAEPVSALREAGAQTELLSVRSGQIQAVRHDLQPAQTFGVDKTLDQADPEAYDALLLPGGAVNADRLRMEPGVQSFIKQINAGATWVDREVVVDGNLVTSRQPGDIPAFTREMLNLFAVARSGSAG